MFEVSAAKEAAEFGVAGEVCARQFVAWSHEPLPLAM